MAAAGGVGVCQLPTEAACGTGKQVCGGSLVCYANSTCVNTCTGTGTCPLASQTCVSGTYCLGPELANSDAGPAGAGGGADVGVGGAADTGVDGAAGTGGALDASSLDSLDGGGGGVPQQCLTSFVNPFAALTPYWANWSGSSCSSVAAANGSLVLTQNEPCSAASPNAIVGLAQPNVLCGDFDVQVYYAVTGLVAGVTGGIFASMRANDPTVTTNGMTIERYAAEYVVPSSQSYQNYKSYTTNQGDDATSVFVPTTDVTGRFRLTRTGTTVKSYYWKTGAPDGQWILVNTATLTNTPWVLVLYEGDNSAANKGPAPYSVTFSNLLVTSPGPTDAGTGSGGSGGSGGAVATPPPDFLWYVLDETAGTTAKDSSSHHYDMTNLTGVTWAQGANFDGQSGGGYTTVAASYRTPPITITAWLKPQLRTDGKGGAGRALAPFPPNAISNDVPGMNGYGIGINVWSDSPAGSALAVEGITPCTQAGLCAANTTQNAAASANPGGGLPSCTSASSCSQGFSAGVEYFVAVTVAAPPTGSTTSTAEVYVNGQLFDETTAIAPPANASPTLYLGCHNLDTNYGTARIFDGRIRDVRVYQRQLAADEVNQLYLNGPTTTAP